VNAIFTRTTTSLALLLLLLGGACSTPVNPSDGRVAGEWGGQHVALTVTSTGAHVEFDCASGEITKPLTADSQGRFSIEGIYVREHPGPIHVGDDPDRQPARYSGRVDGTTMTLDVMLIASNQTVGSFTLTRDAQPRVLKCL
jgi:hypothetical protein